MLIATGCDNEISEEKALKMASEKMQEIVTDFNPEEYKIETNSSDSDWYIYYYEPSHGNLITLGNFHTIKIDKTTGESSYIAGE
ncbi:MAG: hypothetical protein WCT46_02670 [Candidatus Gracilibacteria bacterium]|jgi:hypothetical protein